MGGDSLREVRLSEIKILDFRVFPLFLPDERWIKAVAVYYEELTLFLASVRLDLHLPEEFFVPDLWDIVTKLPAQESEILRDVWYLGHDLASSAGWKRAVTEVPLTRNAVGGTIYIKQ